MGHEIIMTGHGLSRSLLKNAWHRDWGCKGTHAWIQQNWFSSFLKLLLNTCILQYLPSFRKPQCTGAWNWTFRMQQGQLFDCIPHILMGFLFFLTSSPPPLRLLCLQIHYWEMDNQNETEKVKILFLPETSVRLKNLTSYTYYMVKLSAFNAAGDGPLSEPRRGRTLQSGQALRHSTSQHFTLLSLTCSRISRRHSLNGLNHNTSQVQRPNKNQVGFYSSSVTRRTFNHVLGGCWRSESCTCRESFDLRLSLVAIPASYTLPVSHLQRKKKKTIQNLFSWSGCDLISTSHRNTGSRTVVDISQSNREHMLNREHRGDKCCELIVRRVKNLWLPLLLFRNMVCLFVLIISLLFSTHQSFALSLFLVVS